MSAPRIIIQSKDPAAGLYLAIQLTPPVLEGETQTISAVDLVNTFVKINPAVTAFIITDFEPLRRPQWLKVKAWMEPDLWVIQTHARRKDSLVEIPRPMIIVITSSEGFKPAMADRVLRVVR